MSQELTVRFDEGMKIVAHYDGMAIETDQPKEDGGEGSAPSPFDLFLASLGTCTGFYVASFCRARDISTEGVRIVQSWVREEGTKKLTDVRLEIRVPESFPERYRDALVRVAGQCSVKKALESSPKIVTEVVAEA